MRSEQPRPACTMVEDSPSGDPITNGRNMALPIHHLPVLQNWDCHVCGTCCQEYRVTITEEEKQRIEAQGWDRDADLGGIEPFVEHGSRKGKRYLLNHREDDSW